MTTTTTEIKKNKFTSRAYAITTGISLLIMTVAAIFSYGAVLSTLVSSTDSLQTVINIKSSSSLFFLGVAGWIIIIATDAIVSFSLYHYFSDSDEKLSKAAAVIRLAYTLILSVGIYFLYKSGSAIIHSGSTTTISSIDANSLTSGLGAFKSIWSFGLIIFGMHLVVLAIASLKSKGFPKVISYLLIVAGISYTSIHFMHTFLPLFDGYTKMAEGILSVPMTLAELSLAIWMLIKGGKIKA